MIAEFNADRTRLTLFPDSQDRRKILGMVQRGEASDKAVLQDLLPQTGELEGWEFIDPIECGDLTDAPIIGLRNSEGLVVERWGWMDYQVCSIADAIMNTGRAVLVGGD